MKKLILIDSNALVHRAFHALPPTLSSPEGIPTNAVYGFTAVLLKMLKDLKPDYIAATFDLAGPTFRHEEFVDYKAHRPKGPDELYGQIPMVKEVLKALGIPIFEKQGFEADDVIGTLAEKAKKNKGIQVVIVTGDLDTLQLVDGDKVVVFTLKKGVSDTIIYDEKEVEKRYGLSPNQVIDFKGLKGDPSDNIPGVPGVGEKTASMLIQKFETLEKLYDALEKQTQKAPVSDKMLSTLLENKDTAIFSKRLATIVRTVPVDFNIKKTQWKKGIDRNLLEKILRDFGFYSLVKRLPEVLGSLKIAEKEQLMQKESKINVKYEKSDFRPEGQWSIDAVENDKEEITDLLFARDDTTVRVFSLSKNKLTEDIFENITLLVGHGLKRVLKTLKMASIELKVPLFDTEVASYLVSPDKRDYGLYRTFYATFGRQADEDDLLRPSYILKLKDYYWEKLKSGDLISLFEDVEMPLIKVLAEIELNGITINKRGLKKLLDITTRELSRLEKDIYKLAGTEFNINSPKQLAGILFNNLGIRGRIRRTASGAPSTAAGELEKIRDTHPIIEKILDFRELQKLKTTYIEPFPKMIDKDGRLRTSYNQTGTGTGRLASQDPNLQNIPTRTQMGLEFRRTFEAQKGYKLVTFDYSQLELRLVAHIADDKKMIKAFGSNEDIHTRTAAEIFETDPNKVTKDMRRQAKALNFGIIYGMGSLGFARAAGIKRDRAREFIDRYLEEFKGIAAYMADTKESVSRNGYVKTLLGRKRYLPDIYSTMPHLRAQSERMAINHPVQGTGADLIKVAMNHIYDYIHEKEKCNEIRMLLQVHDELVFEIKDSAVRDAAKNIKSIMQDAYKLKIPLVVDVCIGPNWTDVEYAGK
jgi:DNA polymerase-1